MKTPNIIKRVPKWAWLVAGGVGIGGIALRVISNRRDADAAEAGATGTDPATGQAVGTGAPGVIVPPVIMGGSGGDGAGSAALSELAGVLGLGFERVLDTAQNLAWTPGMIAAFASESNRAVTDNVLGIIAGAGIAPAPAAQVPPVINVLPPAPAPTPAATPPAAAPSCPPAFPNRSARGCYKQVGHCDRDKNGKPYRNHGHLYQDGTRVHVRNEYPGGC